MDELSPFQLNVEGVRQLVERDTNKSPDGLLNNPEGPDGEAYDAYSVSMSDEELIKLKDTFEKAYSPYEGKLKPRVEKIRASYLGSRTDTNSENVQPANYQFMALETYLAAALSKNPEAVVYADNTEEGNKVADDVRTMLAFHSDQLVLKRKLAFMVRQHATDLLGVLKPGWNKRINDVTVENRKVRDYIFDPNGYVDVNGDFTSWYGERISISADRLIEEFPKHKAYIESTVEGKLGQDVKYTEWWPNDEFCFYTYKDIILDKHKNPYFKYSEPEVDPITGQPATDPITGTELMTTPRNHFPHPKKPGIFLSIYTLHEEPHDITSNVEQNIVNQQRITEFTKQTDFNLKNSNNGYAFSEDNFNQETAKQAANARRKGNPILVPSGGPIAEAIVPLPAQDIPAGFFNEVENAKNDLKDSWGIQGIASQQPNDDQTARGMILNQSHDTTRIGGSIGDAIEQVADNVFNWLVQLYMVFYDEQHFAAIMGNAKSVEYVELSNQSLDRQLIVSVAPDSLKPKDQVTQMNLATSLFQEGAIGPKTLLTMLDFPNPEDSAADGLLYKTDPMTYMKLNFPEFFAKLQQSQQEEARQQMANQAQATGMNKAAEAANTPPEAQTEPPAPGGPAMDPASAALAEVKLPQ